MDMTTITIQAPRQLFLTLAEVCRLLGYDRKTISAWVKDGRFPPPITVGSSKAWSNTAIGLWIAWQQVCPSMTAPKNDGSDDSPE